MVNAGGVSCVGGVLANSSTMLTNYRDAAMMMAAAAAANVNQCWPQKHQIKQHFERSAIDAKQRDEKDLKSCCERYEHVAGGRGRDDMMDEVDNERRSPLETEVRSFSDHFQNSVTAAAAAAAAASLERSSSGSASSVVVTNLSSDLSSVSSCNSSIPSSHSGMSTVSSVTVAAAAAAAAAGFVNSHWNLAKTDAVDGILHDTSQRTVFSPQFNAINTVPLVVDVK